MSAMSDAVTRPEKRQRKLELKQRCRLFLQETQAPRTVSNCVYRDWPHLARRYPYVPTQLFVVFFTGVCDYAQKSGVYPQRNTLRSMFKCLAAEHSDRCWAIVRHLLATHCDASQLHQGWLGYLQALKHERALRQKQGVNGVDLSAMLRGFMRVNGLGHIALHFDQELQSQTTAYTDGKAIFLPRRVDIVPNLEANRFYYLRLLAHELAHISQGSFEFDWQAYVPLRDLFLRMDIAPKPATQKDEDNENNQGGEQLNGHDNPGYLALLNAVEQPGLLKWLFNLVEDYRIESWLRQRHPGLARVITALAPWENLHQPSDVFCDPLQQVLSFLMNALDLFGLQQHVREADRFHLYASRVKRIKADCDSVEKALYHAFCLYQLLQQNLPLQDCDNAIHEMAQSRQVKVNDESDEPLSFTELGDGCQTQRYPDLPDDKYWSEVDLALDEYDQFADKVQPGAVHIQINALPAKSGQEKFGRQLQSKTDVQLKDRGRQMSMPHLHRFMAAQAQGQTEQAKVFVSPKKHRQDDADVCFVIDLSASMGSDRHRQHDSPLDRVKHVLSNVLPALKQQGKRVQVWGMIDSARKTVSMQQILAASDVYSASVLDRLQVQGFGGFRYGAAVRWWARQQQRRSALVLMTDAGSHYLHQGLDSILHGLRKNSCSGCKRKHNCDTEPHKPELLQLKNELALFNPVSYEFCDLRHALSASKQTQVSLMTLSGISYPPALISKYLGNNANFGYCQDEQGLKARLMRR